MKKQHTKLSENLRALRKSQKITLQELADKLGYSQPRVSIWERKVNPTEPSLADLCRIADIFGVSLDALAGRDFSGNAVAVNTNNIGTIGNTKVSLGSHECKECRRKDAIIAQKDETIANLSRALIDRK